jgi:hypothetical protein
VISAPEYSVIQEAAARAFHEAAPEVLETPSILCLRGSRVEHDGKLLRVRHIYGSAPVTAKELDEAAFNGNVVDVLLETIRTTARMMGEAFRRALLGRSRKHGETRIGHHEDGLIRLFGDRPFLRNPFFDAYEARLVCRFVLLSYPRESPGPRALAESPG